MLMVLLVFDSWRAPTRTGENANSLLRATATRWTVPIARDSERDSGAASGNALVVTDPVTLAGRVCGTAFRL